MKSLKKIKADSRLKGALCGPFRPGHFDGVATIVAHFFRIVRPDLAFFGLKDYQQYRIVESMTRREFGNTVRIVPVPTVREKNGLAMSSRNRYLTPAEKTRAVRFYRALRATRFRIARGGLRRGPEAQAYLRRALEAAGFDRVQYASVCDARSLRTIAGRLRPGSNGILIAGAVYLGATRLIDNVLV